MDNLPQVTDSMLWFRRCLEQLDYDDDTIAEAIRLGQDRIPVFGSQLRGCYVREDGRRDPHFAVPGWYAFEDITRGTVTLLNSHQEQFVTSVTDIRAVLDVNLECVAHGVNP